jgi:hypothetical protein
METMEHTDAIRLQAVEKYVLGELTPALRNEFEAHYFDCSECSLNVRAGVAFAAASRQYFAEAPAPAFVPQPASAGWFAWLKPMIAVPAFAALLLLVGYQNLVTIPHLVRQADSAENAEVRPWFTLVAANVRGSAGTRVEAPSGKAFDLFFDITTAPPQPDSVFLVQMKDSSGKILVARKVSQQLAKKPVNFTVPAGIAEGDYKLVILDQSAGTTAPAGELSFTVAFSSQIQQH